VVLVVLVVLVVTASVNNLKSNLSIQFLSIGHKLPRPAF